MCHFNFQIICYPEMMGSTRELILFDFDSFQIGRYLTVTALSPEVALVDELHSKHGNVKEWKNVRTKAAISELVADMNRPIVSGIRPLRPAFFTQKSLDSNKVPKHMWSIFEKQDQGELLLKHPCAAEELKFENYIVRLLNYFSKLL